MRRICFTINNPVGILLAQDLEKIPNYRCCVFQMESGTAGGTVHYQGYVAFNKPVRRNVFIQAVAHVGYPNCEEVFSFTSFFF